MIGLAAKAGIGLLATAGAATAVVIAITPSRPAPERATVAHHVDGDTFDVQVNGAEERIRLINIDTPETKDPNRPVQCLGPEASAFLANMLPIGSSVRLEFDKERQDRYGRTVAAAFTPDGKMVNAEVARAGLAQVVTYGENDRFRPSIDQAWQEAAANKRGLHAPEVPCTFPGQAKMVSDSVSQAPTLANQPTSLSSQDLKNVADRIGLVRQGAYALLYAIDNAHGDLLWLALTAAEQTQLREQVRSANDTATREEGNLHGASSSARAREDEAARAAAQAETDRIAQEQAAAQAADEKRAAARAQREAEAREVEAEATPRASANRHTGQTGHPCLPGERDGDKDGYCGEGR
ncbi:MAG TPA: thermonuclease family protein [Pseudonocardia sp.]|jgi:micrococcal nuclease|nr:thermonuclease family protein [Pseudonocardia sp.]